MNPKQIFFKFHPFLSIALFLLMGFFLWQNKYLRPKPVNEKLSDISTPSPAQLALDEYKLVGSSCYEEECLFENESNEGYLGDLLGISTISGYYTTIKKSAWGHEEECDSLVITGGSTKTSDFFVDKVTKFNGGFYSVNQNNQPLISLDMTNLGKNDKQKITTSSEEQPVELLVFFPQREGRGAPVCYSEAQILRVN